MPRKISDKKDISSERPKPKFLPNVFDNSAAAVEGGRQDADDDDEEQAVDSVPTSSLDDDEDDEETAGETSETEPPPATPQDSSIGGAADPVAEVVATVGSTRKRRKRKLQMTPPLPDDAEERADEEKGSVGTTKRKRRKKRFRLTPASTRPRKKREPKNKADTAAADGSNDDVKESTPQSPSGVAEGSVADEKEPVTMRLPTRDRLMQYSPLQLLLDYMLRYFCKKDPEQYFWFPVTDKIAPDYSTVVEKPMDLYKMRLNVDNDVYKSLDDFKADVELICCNAILYNEPTTVYYHAANKLRRVAQYVFSQENLKFLYDSLPFMPQLKVEDVGIDLAKLCAKRKILAGLKPIEPCATVSDDMTAAEIVAATKMASERLASRKVKKGHLAFLRQNDDGSTTLNVLTGSNEDSTDVNTKERRLRLGDLVSKLKEGLPGLSQFCEDKSNLVTPVSAVNYGAYGSFGPSYDSTWANLSKEDSQLLLKSVYGDDEAVDYAHSLSAFAVDAGLSLARTVHGLLDALTDVLKPSASNTDLGNTLSVAPDSPWAEHSRRQRNQHKPNRESQNGRHSALVGRPPPAPSVVAVNPPLQHTNTIQDEPRVDVESLRSLSGYGLDMSFLDRLKDQLESIDQQHQQQARDAQSTAKVLRKTGLLLTDLETVQNQRLSRPPAFTLTHTDGAASDETAIAGAALNSLKQLIPSVSPGRLVSASSLHDALGVEQADMDFLRQFMDMPDSDGDTPMETNADAV